MRSPRVVIVGAGFAGVSARAVLLRAGFDVTVIDQHPYNTFQPLLYQVATGGLNPGDITFPIRNLRGYRRDRGRTRLARVTGIDHDAREVVCDDGVRVPYDYLLISCGVSANYFGIPGVEEHSVTLYTRNEALRVRDLMYGGLEAIAARPDSKERSFTTVVVGGGATGVEMAGTMAELRDVALPRAFPELDVSKVSVLLVEAAGQLLTPFAAPLQRYTLQQLQKRGVDVRLNTAIASVSENCVTLASGEQIPADLVVWAAGISGRKEVADWGFELGRGGRIIVEEDLRARGHDRVFAAGDAAIGAEHPLAQLAQPAMQMGKHAAAQIVNLERGRPTTAFHYHDRGTMATIGQFSAVVEFPWGGRFTGLPAWVLWIMVHLMYLLGGRNRISTMINLGARYLTFRRTGAIVGDVAEPRRLTSRGEPD